MSFSVFARAQQADNKVQLNSWSAKKDVGKWPRCQTSIFVYHGCKYPNKRNNVAGHVKPTLSLEFVFSCQGENGVTGTARMVPNSV